MSNIPLRFDPVNELEIQLVSFRKDSSQNGLFWESFMKSEVVIIADEGEYENIMRIFTWVGKTHEACGIFTSLDKINRAMEPKTPYYQIDASSLIDMLSTEKLHAIINPRYDVQFKLNPKDILNLKNQKYEHVFGVVV